VFLEQIIHEESYYLSGVSGASWSLAGPFSQDLSLSLPRAREPSSLEHQARRTDF